VVPTPIQFLPGQGDSSLLSALAHSVIPTAEGYKMLNLLYSILELKIKEIFGAE
jgi:hypothetical protein